MSRSLRIAALAFCSLSLMLAEKTYRFRGPGGPTSYRQAPGSTAALRSPVFYDIAELPPDDRLAAMPAAQREQRLEAARRVVASKLLIEAPAGGDWSAVDATAPRNRYESVRQGWWVVEYGSPLAALSAAAEIQALDGAPALSPIFARHFTKRQALQREVNDPLYAKQWHLTGDKLSIRMGNAWDSVTGKGINIVVVDDGLEVAHEDLSGNAYPLEGNYHVNFNAGNANDPSPLKPGESHGTACAGIAGARGFNNIGVVGVAPEARLMGARLIAGDADDEQSGRAMTWQPAGVITHISSNSWGPADDGKDLGRIGPLQAAGLEKMASTGRDGLGTVYVVSAGNGAQSGDDSSYDEFASSRFTIGVGAVNREGNPSSYSEPGMNVAVSAFGGEFDPPAVIWTTNNSGQDALALVKQKFESSTAPVNYTDAFNGTSAAAPQVSGAAALLLEKNPKLGYRDVKEILMKTARREGLSGGDSFATNGGGFTFSHSFGAGVIDVSAALAVAGDWKNLGALDSQVITIDGASAAIPDGSTDGVVASFDFSGGANLRVEHVELTVDVKHAKRGDLAFVIQSPSGMNSIATQRPLDEGQDLANYKFTSVRHWGESSKGVWRVKVVDTDGNSQAGSVNSLSLRIWGTAAQ